MKDDTVIFCSITNQDVLQMVMLRLYHGQNQSEKLWWLTLTITMSFEEL